MGKCGDKIQQRCKKTSSECVAYERELHPISELTECATIAETTEELYGLVGNIEARLDFTDLESCEGLPTERTPLILFQHIIDMYCTQKSAITTMQATITTMQAQILELQENPCS